MKLNDYQRFVKEHQNRVLFVSDATTDWPDLVCEYIETVKELIDDEEILKKVFRYNCLKIHQDRG